VHSLTLLLILLAFGRWAELVPMPALAAILVVVSYHMSEWRSFRNELRGPRSDVIVLLVTFTLTVLVDLTVAVQVGIVLAAFLFMRRMSEVTNVSVVRESYGDGPEGEEGPLYAQREGGIPKGVQIYAIDGPFFFGAADKFREALSQVSEKPRALVLIMRRVTAIDSTGLHALRNVISRFRAGGTRVIVVGPHAQPLAAMGRAGILEQLGEENLAASIDEALALVRGEPP
jgi:SulP family sulfate permease